VVIVLLFCIVIAQYRSITRAPISLAVAPPASQAASSFDVATNTRHLSVVITDTTKKAPVGTTTITWKETLKFLDECEVKDVIHVNPAASRIEFSLKDNSQYVVLEKVSFEEAQKATTAAANHCDRLIYSALPRFMSWKDATYYLNNCDVDFMESYFNEAEEKVYLKDQTFSTIDSGSAVPLSDMKRAAVAASKRCGYTVGVKEFPKEINETYWADWTDALLLLDKCLISAISVGKNARTGGPLNEIFPKDTQSFAVSNGVDLETAKVAANNASKKCGYNIKAFEQAGGDQ